MDVDDSGRSSSGPGLMVDPETFTESSSLGAVASNVKNLLNGVVALSVSKKSTATPADQRDAVSWMRFEQADVTDVRLLLAEAGDLFAKISPPQLLVIGYAVGYQMWLLQENGRALQLVSDGVTSTSAVRLLRTPSKEEQGPRHQSARPFVAVVEMGAKKNLSIVSARHNKLVGDKPITFNCEIVDVLSTCSAVVVMTTNRITILDASTLAISTVIMDCYIPQQLGINPAALGDQWLAYQSRKLLPVFESFGRQSMQSEGTIASTALGVAKASFSVVSSLAISVASQAAGASTSSADMADAATDSQQSSQPGVVTVLDVSAVARRGQVNKFNLSKCRQDSWPSVVAHFEAHHREPIVHLMFDQSGALLLTCGSTAHDFHVFRLNKHCAGPRLSSAQFLYRLHRGDTDAVVCSSSFSFDSRWVAVSTTHGTTHVFPITPHGGAVDSRSHMGVRVVDKMSRYHTSAGLDDITDVHAVNGFTTSATTSSSSSTSTVSPSQSGDDCMAGNIASSSGLYAVTLSNTVCLQSANRRYPLAVMNPVQQLPLRQIKHSSLLGSSAYGTNSTLANKAGMLASFARGYYPAAASANTTATATAGSSSGRSSTSPSSTSPPPSMSESVCVASVFAAPRFSRFSHLPKRLHKGSDQQQDLQFVIPQSLFMMTSESRLVEHRLEVRCSGPVKSSTTPVKSNTTTGKSRGSGKSSGTVKTTAIVSTALELHDIPLASWDLQRLAKWTHDPLPLSSDNALIESSDYAQNTDSSSTMLRAFCGPTDRLAEQRHSEAESMRRLRSTASHPIPLSSPRPGAETSANHSAASSVPTSSCAFASAASDLSDSEPWKEHIERSMYPEHGRRLWMGPQFEFLTAINTSADASSISCRSLDSSSPAASTAATVAAATTTALLPMEDAGTIAFHSGLPTIATSAYSPAIKHRSTPINMSGRRRHQQQPSPAAASANSSVGSGGSWQQQQHQRNHGNGGTVEVYGSWGEVYPVSGRASNNQSLSSRDVEMGIMEAMHDDSSNAAGDDSSSRAARPGANSAPADGYESASLESVPTAMPTTPERTVENENNRDCEDVDDDPTYGYDLAGGEYVDDFDEPDDFNFEDIDH
eukprot:scpid30786/ scgid32246/ Breast carcinoma-amplified sequence 3; GAOB1